MSDWPGLSIPEVLTLPTSTYAGQVLSLLVDDTNGVEWLFRRNAANTKWRFIGGAALYAVTDASETTASTSYVDLATVGPSITVPAAGLYEIDFGGWQKSTSGNAFIGVSVDGATPSTGTQIYASTTTGTAQAKKIRATVATPATPIKLLYKVSAGTGTFDLRWTAIRPVQI